MPKRMRMNVGQPVGYTKFPQPVCNAVRIDSITVLLRKYISGINPDVFILALEKLLLIPVLI